MHIYGFAHNGKNWTLSKMTDTGKSGRDRWKIEDVKTGKKKAISDECSRLNREIAEQMKAA